MVTVTWIKKHRNTGAVFSVTDLTPPPQENKRYEKHSIPFRIDEG